MRGARGAVVAIARVRPAADKYTLYFAAPCAVRELSDVFRRGAKAFAHEARKVRK